MLREEVFPQVLWNHAAAMNMANQANYAQGHFDKIIIGQTNDDGRTNRRGGKRTLRVGMERKQISNAFLG